MMSKTFDWKEQLQVGDRGQELFATYYPGAVTVYPEHKADFRRVIDGALIELKSDTYSLEKTSNFFMERWGNIDKTKPGGPWRARKDRVGVFVYHFVRHNVFIEFNTKDLCKALEKLTKKAGFICIKSNGWAVLGYKVPILSVLNSVAFTLHSFNHAGIDGSDEWWKFMDRNVPKKEAI